MTSSWTETLPWILPCLVCSIRDSERLSCINLLYGAIQIPGCNIAKRFLRLCDHLQWVQTMKWLWKNKQLSFMFWFWMYMLCGFYRRWWLLTVFSQLWGLQAWKFVHCAPLHSNIPPCRPSAFPPKRMYRAVKVRAKKRGKKGWKCVSEEARVTPSHPVISLLLGLSRCTMPFSHSFIALPSWFSCLVFRLWNLSQGRPCHQGWKTERVEKRG